MKALRRRGVFVKLHLRSSESFAKFFQVLGGVENAVSKLSRPQENPRFAERNDDVGSSQSKLIVREGTWLPAHSQDASYQMTSSEPS